MILLSQIIFSCCNLYLKIASYEEVDSVTFDCEEKLKDTREYAQVRIGALASLKRLILAEGYRQSNFTEMLQKIQDVIVLQVISNDFFYVN